MIFCYSFTVLHVVKHAWRINHDLLNIKIEEVYLCSNLFLQPFTTYNYEQRFIGRLLFLVIPRSLKTRSQNIATLNLFQAIALSLSLLSPVVVILITRLAVILKFLYLCCYGVSITKKFNWQAGEAQCFDCEKTCVCAWLFQTSK